MKKLFFIILLFSIFNSGCNTTSQALPKEKPGDFNFSLKYGIAAANELNTYENTYTKDMIIAENETIEFVLSEEEKKNIYDEFRNLDVLSLPEEEGGTTCQEPHNRYVLQMTAAGEEYHLRWNSACETRAINRWERFMEELHAETIRTREEYQALPEPEGGYE
ncbi:hypothetical protein [Evansella clarkii]|nr:hypothetical protein [Evansella clarkii]